MVRRTCFPRTNFHKKNTLLPSDYCAGSRNSQHWITFTHFVFFFFLFEYKQLAMALFYYFYSSEWIKCKALSSKKREETLNVVLLLLCGRCWTFSFSASTFFLVFRISIQRRAVGENEMGSLNISNPKWWGELRKRAERKRNEAESKDGTMNQFKFFFVRLLHVRLVK